MDRQHTKGKFRLLFLCTGNSCRSQMAEGWCRHLHGDRIEAASAGIETHGLNSRAVQVMLESGIDISHHKSDYIHSYLDWGPDAVITVCDNARESCPVFPGKTRMIHRSFGDPPAMAAALANSGGSGIEADSRAELDCYRQVRDEIRDFISALPEILELS